MYMVPWLPVEMVDVDMATFDSSNVLTTLVPKKDMSEYYQDLVLKAQDDIRDATESLFEEEWEEIDGGDINKQTRKKSDLLH